MCNDSFVYVFRVPLVQVRRAKQDGKVQIPEEEMSMLGDDSDARDLV